MFHNTNQTYKTKTETTVCKTWTNTDFLVSDWSFPKTEVSDHITGVGLGLRLHESPYCTYGRMC